MGAHLQMEGIQGENHVCKEETNPAQEAEQIEEQECFYCGFHDGPGESPQKEGKNHQAGAKNRPHQQGDRDPQESGPSHNDPELIKVMRLFIRSTGGGMIAIQIFHQSPGTVDRPTEPVGHREKKEPHCGNQDDWRDGELQKSGKPVQTGIGNRMHS